ncbi:hypothetical protein HK26_03540 [Acetobacter okinawensis]|uniref:Uncharacterized protein n=1 Tax=Acetobacter okinawensis TaxID=1076594 RepID=A0A252BTR4_9PROT|nr:hypothetical protein HK26_03540 [Acetobacter okinawensis]
MPQASPRTARKPRLSAPSADGHHITAPAPPQPITGLITKVLTQPGRNGAAPRTGQQKTGTPALLRQNARLILARAPKRAHGSA